MSSKVSGLHPAPDMARKCKLLGMICVCISICMKCCAVYRLKFNRWLLKDEYNTCFQIFLNYEFMNCHRVDSKPGTQGLSPSAMLGFAIFQRRPGIERGSLHSLAVRCMGMQYLQRSQNKAF